MILARGSDGLIGDLTGDLLCFKTGHLQHTSKVVEPVLAGKRSESC
jgi:hypothetical protein